MSTNRRATIAKRQRELDQKDRVKEREVRRAERRARAQERAASGQVGPEIGEPIAPYDDGPLDEVQDDTAAAPDLAAGDEQPAE